MKKKKTSDYVSRNNWQKAIKEISPFLVGIKLSSNIGTGFQVFYNPKTGHTGILTAYHVIFKSHKLEGNSEEFLEDVEIELFNYDSKGSIKLKEDERIIVQAKNDDIALIIFKKKGLNFKSKNIDLIKELITPELGSEVGLLSLVCPSAHFNLRGTDKIKGNLKYLQKFFFSGYINFFDNKNCVFIDASARPGMSGGPVFVLNKKNKPIFIGVISAQVYDKENFLNLTKISLTNNILKDIQKIKRDVISEEATEELVQLYKNMKKL